MDDDDIGALIAPMLKRRLFVCRSEPVGPAEAEHPLLAEHLRYLIELEQRGVVFAAGPYLEGGVPGRRALYILRADSDDAARELMAAEPMHKAGARTFTIDEWSLNQGRVTLHVDFSTQRGGLDGTPADPERSTP